MDIDQRSQDVKVFMELNQLNEDEAEAFNSMSLDEWQDQCVRLAKGIKEWANHLELRIASIGYRLDSLVADIKTIKGVMENRNGQERTIAHQNKRKKAIKRSQAFKIHQEHTEQRRSRIAEIIGCDRSEVDELLQLIKWKFYFCYLFLVWYLRHVWRI